jgi:hypothetical protein
MTTSFKDTEAFVDNATQWQKDMDEWTRVMAKEIVDGQDPKTLEEAKLFAQRWIETAAQHSRNEAYWEMRARDAEALLRRCIDPNEGLWALGAQQWEDARGNREEELKVRGKRDAIIGDVRAALGDE